MSDSFHHPDISNSSLYEKSTAINCLLEKKEDIKYTNVNKLLNQSVIEEASTNMRGFIEPVYEQHLKTDQYANKNRCYVNPSTDTTMNYSDCVGFECNTNMMYELDNFNTYHNYPVCKVRENKEVTCCPENIQIFDNITRRNIEIPDSKQRYDLFVNEPIIPKLTYNKCYLYNK